MEEKINDSHFKENISKTLELKSEGYEELFNELNNKHNEYNLLVRKR